MNLTVSYSVSLANLDKESFIPAVTLQITEESVYGQPKL